MRILYTATVRARLRAILIACLLMGQVLAFAHIHDNHEAESAAHCDICLMVDRIDLGPTSPVANSQQISSPHAMLGTCYPDAAHWPRVFTCEARAPPHRAFV